MKLHKRPWIIWSPMELNRHYLFAALLVPLCLFSQTKAAPKTCQVTLPAKDIANLLSRAYVCGRIDGVVEATKAAGRNDLAAKAEALRVEGDCDSVDELIKTGDKLP